MLPKTFLSTFSWLGLPPKPLKNGELEPNRPPEPLEEVALAEAAAAGVDDEVVLALPKTLLTLPPVLEDDWPKTLLEEAWPKTELEAPD